jgi:hypothetical protein
MDYEVVEEIIYGLESGILFGYDSRYTIFVHKFAAFQCCLYFYNSDLCSANSKLSEL